MKIEIKNVRGEILFESESWSFRDAVISSAANGACLRGAHLRGAHLCRADLCEAYLLEADLREADLPGANLCKADLRGADLRGANLRDADLRGADLQGADLRGAYLFGAYLFGAYLFGAKFDNSSTTNHALAKLKILPDGDVVGWKKCKDGALVKLLIPAGAKRSNATGRKCRAEYAKVLEIISPKGPCEEAESVWKLKYRVGEIVRADKWDDNNWNECSHGIHFFITREEAENYML